LSILFLAHEIAGANKMSWTWRYPLAVSASFGLLHGFGFAAVLKDVGLPQTELLTGLLFFNLGVEIGQLIFIALLIFAIAVVFQRLLKPYVSLNTQKATVVGNYFIGTMAAYWFISRVVNI